MSSRILYNLAGCLPSLPDLPSLSLTNAHLAATVIRTPLRLSSLTHLALHNCRLYDSTGAEDLADILTPAHFPALTSFSSRLRGHDFFHNFDRRPPGFDALAAQLESLTLEEDFEAWLGVEEAGLWSRMVKLKELRIMEPGGLSALVLLALRSLQTPLRRLDLTAGDELQYSTALEALAEAWREGRVSLSELKTVVLRRQHEDAEMEMVNAMKDRGVVFEWIQRVLAISL